MQGDDELKDRPFDGCVDTSTGAPKDCTSHDNFLKCSFAEDNLHIVDEMAIRACNEGFSMSLIKDSPTNEILESGPIAPVDVGKFKFL